MHCASDGLERKGGEQGGKFCEHGVDIADRNRQDGCWHKELGKRNYCGIGGKADGGGTVKIIGHRQCEPHLHDGGDE